MIEHDGKIFMISTDGSLKQIPSYLQTEMLKRGWRIVVNPKREYYPEYDQTSPFYTPEKKDKETEILDDQTLEVEVL